MTPSEWEGTTAVDAAARVVYAQQTSAIAAAPPFDALEPLQKNSYREMVLPLVWAALEALNRPEATTATEWGYRALGDHNVPCGSETFARRMSKRLGSYAAHVTDWAPADQDP